MCTSCVLVSLWNLEKRKKKKKKVTLERTIQMQTYLQEIISALLLMKILILRSIFKGN